MPDCKGCAYVGDLSSPICRACGRQEEARVARLEGKPMPLPRDTRETPFQTLVEGEAERLGWWTWHDKSRYKNKKGFLDLFCLRERLVIFELKQVGKCMTPEQQVVFDKLKAAGIEVYCFTILDWNEIQRVLW